MGTAEEEGDGGAGVSCAAWGLGDDGIGGGGGGKSKAEVGAAVVALMQSLAGAGRFSLASKLLPGKVKKSLEGLIAALAQGGGCGAETEVSSSTRSFIGSYLRLNCGMCVVHAVRRLVVRLFVHRVPGTYSVYAVRRLVVRGA